MKIKFFKCLPWFIAIMAHACEDVARQGAVRVLELFEKDPRQESHDPITWALLRPGSFFRQGVEKFASGVRRRDLHVELLTTIGIFRFMPVSETTIERKHSTVSKPTKAGKLGTVRVSLCNRLPMLEKWLLTGKVDAMDFFNVFEQVRKVKDIPPLFGIEEHPDLSGYERMRPNTVRKLLSLILYRTPG